MARIRVLRRCGHPDTFSFLTTSGAWLRRVVYSFALSFVMLGAVADELPPFTGSTKAIAVDSLINGVGASFQYPSSWTALANGPEQMIRVVSDDGTGDEVCVVHSQDITAIADDAGLRDDFIAIVSNNEFEGFLPPGFDLLSGQQIAVADRPAAQIVATTQSEVAEIEMFKLSVFSIVYVEGALVILSCDTRAPTQQQALKQFKSQFPAFSAIANSLTFKDESAVPPAAKPHFTTRFSPLDFP